MRHRSETTRLNRNRKQLKALVRSLATSVILYESVETTKDKAKLVRSLVDRLISRAKTRDEVSAIRYLKKYLYEKNACKKVLETLVPRYKDRSSGFTRIVNSRIRTGDGAQLVVFQLLDN